MFFNDDDFLGFGGLMWSGAKAAFTYRLTPLKSFPNSSELVIDIPGYGKEDVELTEAGDLLSVKVADKRMTFKMRGSAVKSATVKNGQLTIILEQSAGAGRKIAVE